MRTLLTLASLLLLAAPAAAADLTVVVKTPSGQPVKDAVVTLTPTGGVSGPIKFDWPMRMSQHELQFEPFVLIVPVGAEVAFPNKDNVRHHVYSFSPAKRFELKLYGKDETRSVKFDKVGAVALGCDIHDPMVGFIKVVDTPYAAKTDAMGQVVIHDTPAGAGTLRVWHPYLKGLANESAQAVTIPIAGLHQAVVADLRAPPAKNM